MSICVTLLLVLRHYEHLCRFLLNRICRIITGLLIFVDVYYFHYTITHAHIQAQTHKHGDMYH